MPFYRGQPPTNKKKDAEAIAPIFGSEEIPAMATGNQFSPAEIEKMRAVVLDSDRKVTQNNFDLSRPPVVPYVFQKFPMLLYDHKASEPPRDEARKVHGEDQIVHVPVKYVTKTVHSDAELAKALKAGWSEKPPLFEAKAE